MSDIVFADLFDNSCFLSNCYFIQSSHLVDYTVEHVFVVCHMNLDVMLDKNGHMLCFENSLTATTFCVNKCILNSTILKVHIQSLNILIDTTHNIGVIIKREIIQHNDMGFDMDYIRNRLRFFNPF